MTITVCAVCGAEIKNIKDGSNEVIESYDGCESGVREDNYEESR